MKKEMQKVRFHLPDFSGKFRFNYVFASMLENCPEYFRDGVEIASFYGTFPPAMWNGGRFQGGTCDADFIKTVINTFNQKKIPLRFTFTNPLIEEKHLNDRFCNMILKLGENDLNGVIVVSSVLEKYIRQHYPKYKITSSTCKRITDIEKLDSELEKDYNIVVLDYDLNNHFDILEKIPYKEKCEILVNACCEPNCPKRSEHYISIGKQQIAYYEHLLKNPRENFDSKKFARENPSSTFSCNCMNRNIIDIKNLRTHITPDDIYEKYLPMGFNQFKIEGRTSNVLNLMETYFYYMIKPEYADEARFKFIANLVSNGVIKFNE